MGEAKSTAELTIEDIQNQLNEDERMQLLSTDQPPTFVKGLRSCEARINEDFRFTIQGKCKTSRYILFNFISHIYHSSLTNRFHLGSFNIATMARNKFQKIKIV